VQGFDYMGAEELQLQPPRVTWQRVVVSLVAGVLGSRLFPKHPVLSFLGSAALASNVHAAATGEKSWYGAIRRVGCHVVATAGSLALPKHPAIGYVAGAIAGDLLLDGEGGGIVEEWMRGRKQKSIDVQLVEMQPVDAELVESNSKALVKK